MLAPVATPPPEPQSTTTARPTAALTAASWACDAAVSAFGFESLGRPRRDNLERSRTRLRERKDTGGLDRTRRDRMRSESPWNTDGSSQMRQPGRPGRQAGRGRTHVNERMMNVSCEHTPIEGGPYSSTRVESKEEEVSVDLSFGRCETPEREKIEQEEGRQTRGSWW